MSDPRYPQAPPGSYVNEDAYLIVGDEAWTEAEWAIRHRLAPRWKCHRYTTDEERQEARRRQRREHMRRVRARRREEAAAAAWAP